MSDVYIGNIIILNSILSFVNYVWAVVSGFYILHPNDHEKLLKCTYEGCKIISKMFKSGFGKDSAGEQKPMNAALCKLKIDWHGGSKFFCPEHTKYFEHFFGKLDNKDRFHKKARKIGIK